MTEPSQLLAMAAAGRSGELRTALLQHLAGQEGVDPAVQSLLSQALAERSRDDDARRDPDRDDPYVDDLDGDDLVGDDLDGAEPDAAHRRPRDGVHSARREQLATGADEEAARRRRRALWLLRERFADMQVELAELRERNEALAAALGACARCWGVDPGCEVCAGRGVPGSRLPQAPLFAHFVAPAVRRRQDVNRRGSSVPRSDPPPGRGPL